MGNNNEGKFGKKRPENDPKKDNAPYEFLKKAFQRFAPKGQGIDQASMLRICMGGGAPSIEVAQKVLDNLVADQLLRKEMIEETQTIAYYLVDVDTDN